MALLREIVGSDPRALGGVLILRLLPFFLVGPVAGVVADRFSRKLVMVASDLFRLCPIGDQAEARRPSISCFSSVTIRTASCN